MYESDFAKIDATGTHSLKKDSIYIYDSEYVTDIMYGDKVILSITDQDALWQNLSRITISTDYPKQDTRAKGAT